jgi:segregation and condensation protein B
MSEDPSNEPHEVIDLTAEEKVTTIRTEPAVVEVELPRTDEERTQALEAVLFVATEPVATAVLSRLLDIDTESGDRLLAGLRASYEGRRSGLALQEVAGGWRLSTHPAAASIVERFVLSSKHSRLTKASLESLAIVAYKQPVTRHQVASIRGVNSDSVLKALVDRGLVGEVGREEGPGRPVLYGTTPEFLERTGLNSVADLPSLAPFLEEAGQRNARRDPDAPSDPAETEREAAPNEPEPESEPGKPESPGSPEPDPGSPEEDSPDSDRPGG